MGGSQSQSYDLSNESMKSVHDKRNIVPTNNVVDGTLIHITSTKNSNALPNEQELQRIHPLEEIPLTSEDISVENIPITKTSAPKITETAAE
ncbi:hypothetical protein ACH3XW_15055 [Acanthocheilonema viteae]|uniref:Uncharacterized protein n=1 Tax=Acanthocheilonema viteae TaxID=6277 RepID=A0A498SMY8_ACAVI|nr:unnamed protein product [Acanthocheilonema viteae]